MCRGIAAEHVQAVTVVVDKVAIMQDAVVAADDAGSRDI
jgi:hypothetical protein